MNVEEILSIEHKKIALYAKALGHPIRVYIVELLLNQNCCYSGDLTEVLPIAKSTLSQHLKVLKNAGIIQGEINPPKIKYCIDLANWQEIKNHYINFFK